ncbi:uncharacterized protein LOC128876038 [Hylaeus volcanicus]|uniref:uncharacterized protein LOC128876038 n=1 Tax=Hylaeus volcanicus TaxID=313075 RepID=UPI0023B87D63|nr:uncharacterized protein LOC128876038 [Hylaeus volcanicus]
MEWTSERSIELIGKFKNHECLWNVALREYRNIAKKKDAWEEISEHFSTNLKEVEKKMKSLLAAYRRERKKILDSKRSGSGIGATYESKWFAYKHMKFLHDINKPRAIRATSIKMRRESESEVPENNEDSGEGNSLKQFEPLGQGKKRTAADRTDIAFTTMQELLNQELEKKRDEYSIFGELMALEIRKLPTEHERTVVKFKIQEILFQAAMGAFKRSPEDTSVCFERGESSSSGQQNNF